MLERDSYVIQ